MTNQPQNEVKKSNTKTWIIVIVVCVLIFVCIGCSLLTLLTIGAFSSNRTNTPTNIDINNLVKQSRDSQRITDTRQIYNALEQYVSEDNSTSTLNIPSCSEGARNIGTKSGLVNLSKVLVPDFMLAIPTDPSGGTSEDTLYAICKDSNGLVISAPEAEGGNEIKYSE